MNTSEYLNTIKLIENLKTIFNPVNEVAMKFNDKPRFVHIYFDNVRLCEYGSSVNILKLALVSNSGDVI